MACIVDDENSLYMQEPDGKFVMKDFVGKVGLESQFHIESTATSAAEIGDLVYLPVRRKMFEYGFNCAGKTVRQLRNEDCDQYDLLR